MERTVFAEFGTVSAQTWPRHYILQDLIFVRRCMVFGDLRKEIENLWVGEVWIFNYNLLFYKWFVKALITDSLKNILFLNTFLSYRIHKRRDRIQSLNKWAFSVVSCLLIMTFGQRNQVWGRFGRISGVDCHETVDVDIIFWGNYRIFHSDHFCWAIVSGGMKLLFFVLWWLKELVWFFWQLAFYSFSLDVVRFAWGQFCWDISWMDRYVHFLLSRE